MPKIYISNAFSLQMLSREHMWDRNRWGGDYTRSPRPVTLQEARKIASKENPIDDREVVSIVGHADTAAILTKQLGMDVPFNRQSVRLEAGDMLLVGQYVGPRLPEGAKELPEGADIEWWVV